jgi:hypothetical protein
MGKHAFRISVVIPGKVKHELRHSEWQTDQPNVDLEEADDDNNHQAGAKNYTFRRK